jgi:hypothetical protein
MNDFIVACYLNQKNCVSPEPTLSPQFMICYAIPSGARELCRKLNRTAADRHEANKDCLSEPRFGKKAYLHLASPPYLRMVAKRYGEPGSSVSRDGQPGDRGSIPGRSERILPLSSASKPALGPTQPPFPGAKALQDADHSQHLVENE